MITQLVNGIHLPEWDRHFQCQISKNPLFEGKGTYQYLKLVSAVGITTRRRHAVDVGAHVGLWTRVLARSFDHVTAFEPMPEHADCFTLNLNGYDNVRLHQCALGERTTPIRISLIADDIASAMVSDEGDVEVVMKPLDTFDLEDVDFLKIDAEGYAIPVLLGGEETIRRDKPVIVVEQKGADSRYGNAKFAAVDILKAWGARVALKMKGDYALTWDDA